MPRDREAICDGCSVLSWMNFMLFLGLVITWGGGVTWNNDSFSVIMIS